MSKAVFFLIIIFLQFFILPMQAFASEDCSTAVSGNITYDPKVFPPPAAGTDLTLNFTINNDNAYNNLKSKSVRLHYIDPFGPGGDYNTPRVTIPIDKKTFPITLLLDKPSGDNNMITPGDHQTVLDLQKPDGSFEEYCKGIKYIVGDPNVCAIDPTLQSTIPPSPNNIFPLVKFSGNNNTTYYLYIWDTFHIRGNYAAITKTDNSGQGEFSKINIPGSNGDKVTLRIGLNDFGASCSKDITISSSAPPPGIPPPGPVPKPSPRIIPVIGESVPPSIPASAGGEKLPGCTDNSTNPGISTAIGCIHTNPVDLIKDLLKFLTAIGGGIAFLMMLLGAFQMITSAGNPETLQAGRDRFTSAIIGLLFVIFSILLFQIIGFDILKLPGFGK